MSGGKSDAGEELKVVDRRSQHADAAKPAEKAAQVSSPVTSGAASTSATNTSGTSTSATAASDHNETDEEDLDPISFGSFIVGLATQAMMLLGEIPEPQSGRMLSVNLQAARQTIDVIDVLQQKTTGNLTEDESKLVQDVLTSLRIAFVTKAASQAKSK